MRSTTFKNIMLGALLIFGLVLGFCGWGRPQFGGYLGIFQYIFGNRKNSRFRQQKFSHLSLSSFLSLANNYSYVLVKRAELINPA